MDTSDVPLMASLALNIASAVAVPWLLAKLVGLTKQRDSADKLNAGLLDQIAEMRPDAERGKRSRLQAAAALAKANQINRERIAAKAAAGAEG